MKRSAVAGCNRPECGLGVIDEHNFCTECDRRPLAAGVLPSARSAINMRPDPWWGLELVETGYLPQIAEAQPEPNGGQILDIIAGRYEVKRVIDSGGSGVAYLARDRNLNTDVVLKLLHARIAETARRERDALVALRHDNIVRILSYEPDGPYLVLEHVPGAPISARSDDRLEVVLAHGLQILQALDYLHARGLWHCDVKPGNIIRFCERSAVGPRDRVRLIDFGAVRTVHDNGPVTSYTEAFAPPITDREHQHPTAGFDLFCLGQTLKNLCRSHLHGIAAPGADSLRLLLDRATDRRAPERRFVSARQFAEQLSGVVRQIVAVAPAGRQVTRPSALFGSMTEPLHGGLGAPRPLGHWVTASVAQDASLTMPAPFTTPTATEVAAALPAPLADPDDPPDDPRTPGRTEHALAECRAALPPRDTATAQRAVDDAQLPAWHWLGSWYRGLIAMASGDISHGTEQFTAVQDLLPGELIPRLAVGLCAELDRDLEVAQRHYKTVFDTAPALGAAGFSLARVQLLAGHRAEAVSTAERLAQEFRFEREAQIAAVRSRAAVLPPTTLTVPTHADLAWAGELAAGLEVGAEAQIGLRTEILYAQFVIAGDRLKLSEAVRELAGHAQTERDHTALVDLANRLRPALEWRWPRMPWRTRSTAHGETVKPAMRALHDAEISERMAESLPGLSFTLGVEAIRELTFDEKRADALITVTARPAPGNAPDARGAEILIMDRSLSMASGTKLDEAKRAMCAAIDTLRDGSYLGIIAGDDKAETVYPAGGGLAVVDADIKEAAKQQVKNQRPQGGTAIGSWLTLADKLFGAAAGRTVRHAVLYTDGKNEYETSEQLGTALASCADRFVCDARGLGDDWNYAELLRITEALHGTSNAVISIPDLAEDFAQLMRDTQRLLVPHVYLVLKLNKQFRLHFVRQTHPVEADLTNLQQGHGREIQVPLGSWAPGIGRYQLSMSFEGDMPIGEELRAARVELHAGTPDSGREPCAMAAVVVRRHEPGIKPGKPEDLTRVEDGHALGQAMRACADAYLNGDTATADYELNLAMDLAPRLGGDARLGLLEAVAIVGDDGTARLRPDVTRGEMQKIGLDSTKTGYLPADATDLPPADAARCCRHCGETTDARDLKYCKRCRHPLDESTRRES